MCGEASTVPGHSLDLPLNVEKSKHARGDCDSNLAQAGYAGIGTVNGSIYLHKSRLELRA